MLCRIELFCQLKIRHTDQEQTRFRTQKNGWILAYLALHLGQSITRERLLDLFWPEMNVETGRGNLNNALSSLRRQLEPSDLLRNTILLADRQMVRLNPQAIRTDVQEFEELLRDVARASPATPMSERVALLERAASLYRGELLPGCYEEWASQEQHRLHQAYVDLLGRWDVALEEAEDFAGAILVLQRARKADPYREEFYQRLMRLYVTQGQPAAAIACYQEMQRLFDAELSVLPSAATQELLRQIQQNPRAVVITRPVQSQEPAPPEPEAPAPVSPGSVSPGFTPSNTLPQSLTRFVGRTTEIVQLTALLTEDGVRLVTLLGPGGTGKTRLAQETARQITPAFGGRVWWVPLADLPDARLLYSALARSLQVSTANAIDPLEPILARLNEARCLLVLDNMEHLLRDDGDSAKGDQPFQDTATVLVRLLLERVPNLHCLITSRRALRLGGEQEFSVPPLSLPVVSALPEEVLDAQSVSLFVDRARLVLPDFAISANNAEAVARLCRKLEGIPLAIEMAAAWIRTLPPTRMLERLENRLDALTSRRRDLPARHQSLRATIDWSYNLLNAQEARLLARLYVFRGGWSLEAAEAVCADENNVPVDRVLDILTSLVDKSLVLAEEGESEVRYRLLETVRQYAGERLQENGEMTVLMAQHYTYFRAMAKAAWGRIRSTEQGACLDQLEREHDNLRAALIWSRTEAGRSQVGPGEELDLAGWIRPLWDMRGYWREGRERLEEALRNSAHHPSILPDVRARALIGVGVLAANQRDFPAAQGFYEESLILRRQIGDVRGVASVAMGLGNLARDAGDFAAAHRWYDESLAAAREIDSRPLIGSILTNLGYLADREGDVAAEQRYQEESLALHRQEGYLLGIAIAQMNLSHVFVKQRNFPAIYAALAESLSLLQQVGDRRITADVLWNVATTETLQGRNALAIRYFGAAQRILEEVGVPPHPNFERALLSAKQDIEVSVFQTALEQGRALNFEEAIADALETVQKARST